jgi:hypothetical protein
VDGARFDFLTRQFTASSRRGLVRALSGGGLAALGSWPLRLLEVGATKKRKHTRRKPTPNAFGCLDVGQRCKRAGDCCSNICKGNKGKKRCQAHDTGGWPTGVLSHICGDGAHYSDNSQYDVACFRDAANRP